MEENSDYMIQNYENCKRIIRSIMKRIILFTIGVFICFHLKANDFPGAEGLYVYSDLTLSLRPFLRWEKPVNRTHLCEDGVTRDIYYVGYRVYEDGELREIFAGNREELNMMDLHWRGTYEKEYSYKLPPTTTSHSYSISLGWSFVPLRGFEDISEVEIFESPRSEEFFFPASPYFGYNKERYGGFTYELISEEDRTCRLIKCDEYNSDGILDLAAWTNGHYYTVCGGLCDHPRFQCHMPPFGYRLVELAPRCFEELRGRYSTTNVYLSGTITTISDSAFWSWGYLRVGRVVLSRSVITIGKNAFDNMREDGCWVYFPGDSIPPLMTTIGEYAFTNAHMPISKRLYIPQTVDSIAKNAFYKAIYGLGFTIIVDRDIPLDIDDETFRNMKPSNPYMMKDTTKTLEVPPGTVELYRVAKGWRHFENIVETVVEDVPEIEFSSGQSRAIHRFSLDGLPLREERRGVNLIRMDDGSIRKVMVK